MHVVGEDPVRLEHQQSTNLASHEEQPMHAHCLKHWDCNVEMLATMPRLYITGK